MATNTTVVGTRVAKPKAAAGPWREAAGRLFKNKLAVVGLVIVHAAGRWLAKHYPQPELAPAPSETSAQN